jgi:DNA (cytosine-5)-methyltransferase 1
MYHLNSQMNLWVPQYSPVIAHMYIIARLNWPLGVVMCKSTKKCNSVTISSEDNAIANDDLLSTIDLYSGSGAVTTALKKAGFKVVAAVDNNPTACETYRLNHREVNLHEGDIRKIPINQISASSEIGLLVVCAPCQPFSMQNKKRENDPRAKLVLESLKYIKAFSPRLVFFENVPGLANSEEFIKLSKSLNKLKYKLSEVRLLDSADFGVPQRRTRCVLMASKSEKAIKLFNEFTPQIKRRTVLQAIGHLPWLNSGESDPKDPMHRARNHKQIVLQRLRYIPKDGGSRSSLPMHLRLDCHKRMGKNQSYNDVYGRMKWNDVAPTLTTGCTDVTKGRFAHPEQDRAITLREAAILQGFPKSYKFSGSSGSIAAQIGNAVPVGLVIRLAPLMKRMIAISAAEK